MQLTYAEAQNEILGHTELGWTMASQDRLWTVFIFDLWSEGKDIALRYNRLFCLDSDKLAWSYDMYDDELMWTTRAEAEHYAMELRHRLLNRNPDGEQPDVYVMNWGDDSRYEAGVIGRDNGRAVRTQPKYKGSEAAWEAMIKMHRRWAEEVSPIVFEQQGGITL